MDTRLQLWQHGKHMLSARNENSECFYVEGMGRFYVWAWSCKCGWLAEHPITYNHVEPNGAMGCGFPDETDGKVQKSAHDKWTRENL